MKLNNYIKLLFVLAVFLTADRAFSMTGGIGNPNTSLLSASDSNDFLTIYKKKEKGLDVYTFTPKKKGDEETIKATENRLKVMVEGFVSFSVDKKNMVKVVTDPNKITEDNLSLVMSIVVKIHEYLPTNYTIEEL